MIEISQIDRLYGCVTLELPLQVHDWFLREHAAGAMPEAEGYEEFLSRIILKAFREQNPRVATPGLLCYEE